LKKLFGDFETFFGSIETDEKTPRGKPKTFNLSLKNNKLSYTDYVRHPEFEVLGISVRWEDEDEATFIRGPDVAAWLAQVDWENTIFIAHNAVFDGLVLYETYGHVPAQYFCTMACAEAVYQGAVPVGLDSLGELFDVGRKSPDLDDFRGKRCADLNEEDWLKLGGYANNDTEILYGLYHKLETALPPKEIELMNLTIKLFCDPALEVDVEMAQEALDDAESQRSALVAKTGLTQAELSGNISFEKALRAKLGYIPLKTNPKGEVKPAFAKTDLDFVMLKSHENEDVQNLVKARMEVKSSLNITRAERLITLGTTGSKKCNVCLHYGRAHTMRWTGGNKMNFQNMTRGSKLRLSVKAPEGYVLPVVDSSQIEARVLAVMASQEDLVEVFRQGGDPYSLMASKVYGYEVNKNEHPVERFMGKTMVLGLGYGMGWKKFYNEIRTGARGMALNIEPAFAQRAVEIYRTTNDKIMAFHKTAESWLWYLLDERNPRKEVLDGLITLDPATKRVIFPNGCYLRYPELSHDDGNLMYKAWNAKIKKYEWKKIYGGMFVENLVQAIARHIVADQILEIAKKYRCVLFVHDECVYMVPVEIADEALEFGLNEFRKKPDWFPFDIPLDSEGGYDTCYSK
jgi:DNA polymerase I-like protein with 3'-5' exonuclease and polymerase domains